MLLESAKKAIFLKFKTILDGSILNAVFCIIKIWIVALNRVFPLTELCLDVVRFWPCALIEINNKSYCLSVGKVKVKIYIIFCQQQT